MKLKLIFLIILIIFGNNVNGQRFQVNDTLKPFLRKNFKITIIDEIKGDSLAIITKKYLSALYMKIKYQDEIIKANNSTHSEDYIKQLNLTIDGLIEENKLLEEKNKNSDSKITVLNELIETEKKSTQFEKDRVNKISNLYDKQIRKNKILKSVGYVGFFGGLILGVFVIK